LAHRRRLATIRNADRILVFEDGRVVESGTFDERVARGGRFLEVAQAQEPTAYFAGALPAHDDEGVDARGR